MFLRKQILKLVLVFSTLVIVLALFLALFRPHGEVEVVGEEYNPIGDYNETVDILKNITERFINKTTGSGRDAPRIERIVDRIKSYRDNILYKPGFTVRDVTIAEVYLNVSLVNRRLHPVSMAYPRIWHEMVKSIELLSELKVEEAIAKYDQIRNTLLIIRDSLVRSRDSLLKTSYRNYTIDPAHVVAIDNAIFVLNDTIRTIDDYVKFFDILRNYYIEALNGGNQTEISVRLVKDVRDNVNLTQVEKISDKVYEFLNKVLTEGLKVEYSRTITWEHGSYPDRYNAGTGVEESDD